MNSLGDAQTGFPLFAGESGDDCVFPDKSAGVNTHEPDVPACRPEGDTVSIFTIIEQAKHRDDVVDAYAYELRADLFDPERDTDWRTVNLAIIDKWSVAALRYIKDRAWKEQP